VDLCSYSIPNTQYSIRIQHSAWRRAHGGNVNVIARSEATKQSQYPIPNTQYPIPNTQYPILNTQYEFSIAHGAWVPDRRPRTVDCGLWTVDRGPWTVDLCSYSIRNTHDAIRIHLFFLRCPGNIFSDSLYFATVRLLMLTPILSNPEVIAESLSGRALFSFFTSLSIISFI